MQLDHQAVNLANVVIFILRGLVKNRMLATRQSERSEPSEARLAKLIRVQVQSIRKHESRNLLCKIKRLEDEIKIKTI